MSFQWPLDPQELFGERYAQMINTGLPVHDVDAVRAVITDMWADAPGGWVYEWSKLAATYAEAGSHQTAALAYGWAKFPALADDSKRAAHATPTRAVPARRPRLRSGLRAPGAGPAI